MELAHGWVYLQRAGSPLVPISADDCLVNGG